MAPALSQVLQNINAIDNGTRMLANVHVRFIAHVAKAAVEDCLNLIYFYIESGRGI